MTKTPRIPHDSSLFASCKEIPLINSRKVMPSQESPSSSGKSPFSKIKKLKKSTQPSSQRWLLRQLNDPYVQRAQEENRLSRAFYKLEEINERFEILLPHQRVLDLGCAPGGWCQYVQEIQKSHSQKSALPSLVGIDLRPMVPLNGMQFLQGDFLESEMQIALGKASYDVILSDMAPFSSGQRRVDAVKMEALLEALLETLPLLKVQGNMVFKAFHSPVIQAFKPFFSTLRYVKPKASRKESKEIYIVAKNFVGL